METELRYHPSDEQRALANTMDTALADLLPLKRLHDATVEADATWSGLAEIGLFDISTAPEHGGSGLGATEEVLIVMGLGKRLASPAVLATIGAAHASSSVPPSKLRARRVAAAYRREDRIVIVEEPSAAFVLLRTSDSATLYEAPDRDSRLLDRRLWLAGLRTVDHLGTPLTQYDAKQMLRLRLIDAAALAGVADATLEMSVAYAGARRQFGRPIGSFQAIKHHCANMAIAASCARDQTSFAAVAFDDGREDAALQIESALFVAAEAALENAAKNIQIHGGIGFSDEADPHLFLKRARLLMTIAGGLEAATRRVARVRTA